MTIQTINLGTYANSSTGDDLRTAFEKVNANFAFLDLTSAVTADNIGAGARVFKEKIGDNLQLRSVVAGTGITVVENTNNITVTSVIDITRDTAPQLGGNLVLGGFDVTGTGNINTTGTATFSGNVTMANGNLITTATTANLVNTVASTVNLAGAADFLTLSKPTGLTTVAGELQVNDDIVITNNGRLKTTNSSAYVFNETANYVFVGQSAVRVDLGSVNGIVGLGHDGEVANNFTVSGTIYGNFEATQGTVDLLTVVNTLYANDISLSGNLSGNLVGNVTGDTAGTHTGAVIGNVTGNVTGNAGTVTNGVYTTSSINTLADVDTVTVAPTNGQTLIWNTTNWVPGTIAPGGVTRIIAGANISINPTSGLGDVTITSTAVSSPGGNLDFGTFTAPAGFTLDMGTF